MSTSQAEREARKYLGQGAQSDDAAYERAVRKAAASIQQLQQAVRLAQKQTA